VAGPAWSERTPAVLSCSLVGLFWALPCAVCRGCLNEGGLLVCVFRIPLSPRRPRRLRRAKGVPPVSWTDGRRRRRRRCGVDRRGHASRRNSTPRTPVMASIMASWHHACMQANQAVLRQRFRFPVCSSNIAKAVCWLQLVYAPSPLPA
jgi:hypothetical protein